MYIFIINKYYVITLPYICVDDDDVYLYRLQHEGYHVTAFHIYLSYVYTTYIYTHNIYI